MPSRIVTLYCFLSVIVADSDSVKSQVIRSSKMHCIFIILFLNMQDAGEGIIVFVSSQEALIGIYRSGLKIVEPATRFKILVGVTLTQLLAIAGR